MVNIVATDIVPVMPRNPRENTIVRMISNIAVTSLIQEIAIVIGSEIGLCRSLTTEGITVTEFLQVVETAGDTLVTVGVECVEIDRCSSVHTAVNFGAGENGIAVCVYDAGSSRRVCVDEVGIGVCEVIGALHITVTKRIFDCGKGRNASAVALELCFPLVVSSFDGSLDFCDRCGIALGNDQGYGILG